MEYRHRSVARQTGPDFSATLVPNGYALWYLDALSDCGRYGLTVIAMLGCVFSPFYARARRGGPIDPLAHSALNVALYTTDRRGTRHWAMTERDLRHTPRQAEVLAIGPSRLIWDGTTLEVEIDEREAPLPRRLRGRIRFVPALLSSQAFDLDRQCRHRWWPIAPRGTIDVAFDAPALRWRGTGYLDANQGEAPLEHDFLSWEWSRASTTTHTQIFYDRRWTDGTQSAPLALAIDTTGTLRSIDPPPRRPLPKTGWGLERSIRAKGHDDGPDGAPVLVKTLESGPFYARSLVRLPRGGPATEAIHESVSLDRFRRPWVQALLPVRTRRSG